MQRDDEVQAVEPCARCRKPSRYEVWEKRLCGPCSSDWFREAQADASLANAKADQYRSFTAVFIARGAA